MLPAILIQVVNAAVLADTGADTLPVTPEAGVNPTIVSLTVFVLACFIGYYVVWRVTPALHSPLMAVTNAISSVIIVGAIIAAGAEFGAGSLPFSQILGFVAVTLAAVNIFGGFAIAQRMLGKFRKKPKR